MITSTRRASLALLHTALATWVLSYGSKALADQTISVDGTGTGRVYEGIGAVTGGGGTSVLLRDYVEPQRAQILDYLFKPNFGAGLQELYVEIGGDGNSTQGSEPSHMHSATDENYYRGYEWWLMEQARARNPSIFLDATAWSAPGWVGNGNFWSQDTATYLSKWISGAKSAHGLDIDYVGCRNEKGNNESWAQLFRTTLNTNGLTNVGIHAFDNWGATSWTWATDMNTNATLKNAVYAIGSHTTASYGSTNGTPPPANVIAIGKPMWDTEEHVYEHGFQCAIDIVGAFNFNYVNSQITKTIYWYLITSFYSNEPFYDDTMAVASTPWSGAYTINPALWGYAHVGQFTKTGWKYLDAASGKFTGGGNYVTMVAPSGGDFSVIAQTSGATGTQNITFNVTGGLSAAKIYVWQSNSTAQFQQQPSITPVNGSFTVAMGANSIYSITTTTGQQKGATASPAAAAFPFPYYETYDHYGTSQSVGYRPYYHADIAGGFELANRPDGTGQCLRQVISQPAQSWAPETNPYTIVGDTSWTDYEVSADVSFETTTGWASIVGRINSTGTGYGTNPNGYSMTMSPTGACTLYASTTTSSTATTLATGQATLAAGSWHNMKLVFQGTSIKGVVDGTQVLTATNGSYSRGNVGLGTAAKTTAMFDNLIVNTVNGAKPAPTVFKQDSSTGGTPGTGGATSTGGTATSTGGTSNTGGTSGKGGTPGAGGTFVAVGGAKATGGSAVAAGGNIVATGGSKATGGSPGAGGAVVATGGAIGAGGVANTGGANATGGVVAATGGTGALGGNVSTGGIVNVGGAVVMTGGVAGIGGNAAVGGIDTGGTETNISSGGNGSPNTGSCSCRVPSGTNSLYGTTGRAALVGLAFVGLLRRRRQR